MGKKRLLYKTVIMIAFVCTYFVACSTSNDDDDFVFSDEEILEMLQGSWKVTFEGESETWIFSGNTVAGVYGINRKQQFSVSSGVLMGNAFEGGIVLTKLTDTSFEGYYMNNSNERYSGKRVGGKMGKEYAYYKKIVGKWDVIRYQGYYIAKGPSTMRSSNVSEDEVYEFMSNGTLVIYDYSDHKLVKGKGGGIYEIVGEQIQIYNNERLSTIYTIEELSDTKLILSQEWDGEGGWIHRESIFRRL